ncbi:MAG: hemerythrin domain-containing protein [Gemmatimonas sp.]
MDIHIPESVRAEHHELQELLARATRAGGRTEEAAKEVARLLHAHFLKEEAYALPPLGLLGLLASGAATPGMAAVLALTDKLEAELPTMLEEHRAIVGALVALVDAAGAEGKPEVARFAEKLILHAQTEEQVMYPAALLVGRYLKAVLPANAC